MKDLFGQDIPEPQDDVEFALRQRDKATVEARISRRRYLEAIYTEDYDFLTSPDTHYLFRELQGAFVDGHFVACIMLSQVFIERLLQDRLVPRGLNGHTPTLPHLLDEIRARKLMHPFIIDKIAQLCASRNPLAHIQDFDYPYGINERSYKLGLHTNAVLEAEAKETLTLVFKVLFTELSPR